MADEEHFLIELADAVLDGRPLDWPRTLDNVPESAQTLVEYFRTVAEIASFHLRTPAPAESDAGPAELDAAPPAAWGPLTILGRIGRGSFGDVYRARDVRLDRPVALKLLRHHDGRSGEAESAVVEEARRLARVRHPNVVTVYGAERIDGRVGLWMELVEGRTLAEEIREHGPVSGAEVVRVGIHLCRALAAVHRAGLLHGDIKAQNVVRDEDGRIVLMDFGAGRSLADEAQAGVAGTPLYLAPEIVAGGPASIAGDIYSLGVLLYHVATGSFPVRGASLTDLRTAHARGDGTTAAAWRPRLPRRLAAVIDRAIDRDSTARFASAAAFEAALIASARTSARALAAAALAVAIAGAFAFDLGGLRGRLFTEATPTRPAAPSTRGSDGPVVAPGRLTTSATPAARETSAVSGTPARQDESSASEPPERSATSSDQAERSPEMRRVRLPSALVTGRPSRDGRFLAYADLADDLHVWEAATGRSRRITESNAPGAAGASVMSPEGGRVAYLWKIEGEAWELRSVNADGTWPAVLLARQTAYEPVPVDWSHDGHDILCLFRRKDGRTDLSLVPASGGAPRVVQTFRDGVPQHASLSPDGRFIVYARPLDSRSDSRDLFIVATDGTAPRLLLESPANERLPLWAPDGGHVLFLRDSTQYQFGSQDVWALPVMNGLRQGEPILVASNIGDGEGLALTDGGALLDVHDAATTDAYTASIDLTGTTPPGPPTRISEATIGNRAAPAWSPDGRSIAYMTTHENPAHGVDLKTLTVLDVGTRHERHLDVKLHFLGGYTPRWLPDGDSVIVWGYLDRMELTQAGYFRVDVQTGEMTTIVLGKGAPPFFSVSTDGRDLLYVDARGIVARDLTTGEERVAVARDTRSFVGWIGISPDGRSIAFVGWSEERGQQVRALEVQTLGGVSRELVRVQAPNDLRFHAWTPDGQHLLYTTLTPGRAGYSLRSVAVDGGEPRDMRFSLGQIVNPISLSPDGRTIAYPDRIIWSDLWIRERFWPAALSARQR